MAKEFVCIPQTLRQSIVTPLPIEPHSSPSHSFHTQTEDTTPYPLIHYSDLAPFSSDYVMSLASVLQTPEPSSYTQAQQYLEWEMGHRNKSL